MALAPYSPAVGLLLGVLGSVISTGLLCLWLAFLIRYRHWEKYPSSKIAIVRGHPKTEDGCSIHADLPSMYLAFHGGGSRFAKAELRSRIRSAQEIELVRVGGGYYLRRGTIEARPLVTMLLSFVLTAFFLLTALMDFGWL